MAMRTARPSVWILSAGTSARARRGSTFWKMRTATRSAKVREGANSYSVDVRELLVNFMECSVNFREPSVNFRVPSVNSREHTANLL
jgi:hypothetical protein